MVMVQRSLVDALISVFDIKLIFCLRYQDINYSEGTMAYIERKMVDIERKNKGSLRTSEAPKLEV